MEKENFGEFLKSIPEDVTQPLERKRESVDELLDESDLLCNELDILETKTGEESKEAQIRLLPQVKKLIAELQAAQREEKEKYDKEGVKISLTKLIHRRDKIEAMIN